MAEDIKAKIGELHNSLQQIKGLRKNLAKGFYDIGVVLKDIQARQPLPGEGLRNVRGLPRARDRRARQDDGAPPRPHRGPLR